MTSKMRRKSSSFRPHNWIYPNQTVSENISWSVTLEQLPIVILEAIFDYLQTPDLLQLCLVSRYFYLPAANRLYQNICITNETLAITYAKEEMRNWRRNYCTVVTPNKVGTLLQVVSNNEKLAAMVSSVIITETVADPLISTLLSRLRLKTLHCAGPIKVPSEAAQTLQEMTCSLKSALVYAPNIVELKINHTNKDSDSEQYRLLALRMIDQNCHRTLKKLVFEHLEERNLQLLNNFNNELENFSPHPAWSAFFNVFAQKKAKLNLMALGIDGFLGNMGVDTVQLLDSAVQLSDLVILELNHTEHSHPGRAHGENMVTFLEAITKSTPSLQYLSINPTDNCLTCQIDGIENTLKNNIPNHLKHLQITIEPRTSLDSEVIEKVILKYQKNLAKLKFEDRSNTMTGIAQVLKHLEQPRRNEWNNEMFYEDITRRVFMPHILGIEEPRPFLSKTKVETIKLCRKQILDFLNSNTIFLGAHANLPFLKEYCVLGLQINVKECGVFSNGETILLQ